jgi:hypothetical protein
MRWFKKAKTVYNLGTHITNIASNVTLAQMHDIPVGTMAKAAQLYVMFETRPNSLSVQDRQLVRAFKNSNAVLGDFSSAEVKEALYDAMRESLEGTESGGVVGRLTSMMGYERAKADWLQKQKQKLGNKLDRIDQIVTETYAAEDNVFRLAAFLKHAADIAGTKADGKLSPADLQAAGDFARWAFLDYDIDAKAVRVARQTLLPFISWTYAIAPVLGRIAVQQPWKLANLFLGYTILEHVLQEMTGGDEEDEKMRKVGPEYIRDRMFGFGPYMHVRIPFLGDDKNPVYYRLGDYVVPASVARGLPNGFMGQDWWPSFATPTGPIVSAVAAMVAGTDPYTGKDLSPPTDSQWEKLIDRSKYMAGQFLPNYPINPQQWTGVVDMVKGRTDKPENYAALQMARWGGLKLYSYDPEQSALSQNRAAQAIMSEYKREVGRIKRAEARFENPDWEGFMQRQQELLERMQKEVAKAKGEE